MATETATEAKVEDLRAEFRFLRRNALHIMTKEQFDEEVAKACPTSAQEFVKAARKAKVVCNRCRGTGTYVWGAVVNGVPSHSGPCFRCKGKGYQDQADARRNFGYDMHRSVV